MKYLRSTGAWMNKVNWQRWAHAAASSSPVEAS